MSDERKLTPGEVIDRYEVVDILGAGGSAEVYRVRHRQLGSDHAIKLLTSKHAALKERLTQEGRVQAKFLHANIVTVNDIIEHDGRLGLVMEFVRGPTLDKWMVEHGPVEPLAALRLMDGVLSAVVAAHQAEVLHRDLKPANVLLDQRSGGTVARVTDFGIAKVFNDDARAGHTRSGLAMGTPGYMAPEQWADAATADVEADVFALGVMLYELMAGVRPYEGATATAVLEATLSGRHVPLIERVPEVPPGVAAAIERAILPDPQNRFPSVRQLHEALQEAVGLGAHNTFLGTRAEHATVAPTLARTAGIVPVRQPTLAEGSVPDPLLPPAIPTSVTDPGIPAPRGNPGLLAALAIPVVGGAILLAGGAAVAVWVSGRIPADVGDTLGAAGDDPNADAILIDGGPYFFGEPEGRIDVAPYRIDRTEVSTAQYLGCVQAGVCSEPAWRTEGDHTDYAGLMGQRQPIVGVSYTQAAVYCAWRAGRLPSEIEWERAALWSADATVAGDKRPWPWGAAPADCRHANYGACYLEKTLEVDDLEAGASAYGLVHMTGNAWEWTSTEFERRAGGLFRRSYRDHRVLKGGGYGTSLDDLSPTDRFHAAEDAMNPLYGFRCVYDE